LARTPELLKLSLSELSAELLAKRCSPVELMTSVLGRLDAVDGELNAVCARADRDDVLRQARAAEARILRGEGRPLEGIPLGVKDLEDAEGLVTSQGSVPFRENVALRDSTQVARLKAAGAIVVGKTNAPEFGSGAVTKNLLFGATRNPWNLELSPGGSSGGSAAALAGNLLPLVTASDGGGSIRIPACLVGAFGLKPSFGRIPTGPFDRWVWIDTTNVGPLTKTVGDAALFLDQVVGASHYDENSLPHPGYSYVQKLAEPLPRPLRIAFSLDWGYGRVQKDVADAVRAGVRVFEQLGHAITVLDDGPPTMAADWAYLNNVEFYLQLQHLLPEREEDFGRAFIGGAQQAAQPSPESLEMMVKRRALLNQWCASVFLEHDLLITPTMPYDGYPARGPYPTEIDGEPVHHAGPALFTIPFNLSFHPAATLRVGMSSRGLPLGMQIVGHRHRDDLVLQAAFAFEQVRPWHPHWPEL
jgi:aspartyl-tRNA(Asn)/glutamyl-tRNA(Gln) amidotransferase subunit A